MPAALSLVRSTVRNRKIATQSVRDRPSPQQNLRDVEISNFSNGEDRRMKTSICHPKVFASALTILLVAAHAALSMAQSDEWIKIAIEKEIANSPELGGEKNA